MFLDQTIGELSQDRKVISVQLALLAEMLKGKPWTSAALEDMGGTEGVGFTFLEETFSSVTANPKHRLHQQGARRILKALMPERDSNIKGSMRSYEDLLEAAGYSGNRKRFDDLLRILDGEIRLITPTDPESATAHGKRASATNPEKKYYQLTHDYLVPSLRDWLTRKQRETRRGRV